MPLNRAGMAVTVELLGPQTRIVVHRLRAGWASPAAELRGPLMNLETYMCSQGGQTGCYVAQLDTDGEDLLCILTSTRVIEGWPEGADLVCLVRVFPLHLREMALSFIRTLIRTRAFEQTSREGLIP